MVILNGKIVVVWYLLLTEESERCIMSEIVISKQEAGQMVMNYKSGQFFTVKFIKRTDGSLRTMNCRKGVRKNLKGVGHSYDPAKKKLVCVRDVQKRAYRMISLENITELSMRGKKYIVVL